MSDELNPICRSYGATKPKKIEAQEAQDLEKLNDLAKVVKMLDIIRKVVSELSSLGKDLSDKALSIYSGIKVSSTSAMARIIMTFEGVLARIDKLPKQQRAELAVDRAKFFAMLIVVKRARDQITEIGLTLSRPGLELYSATSNDVVETSATVKMIKTLELTAQRMGDKLPASDRNAIGLVGDRKVPDYAAVEKYIKAKCTPMDGDLVPELVPLIPSEPISTVDKGPKKLDGKIPEVSSKFAVSGAIGTGFSHRFSGSPDVFPGSNGGVLADSVASLGYILNNPWTLQLDYKFSAAYDVEGPDNLLRNDDKVDLSARYKGEDLAVIVKAGARRYRNDYPMPQNPNGYSPTQDAYASYKMQPNLQLNLQENYSAQGLYISPNATYIRDQFRGTFGPSAGYSSVLHTFGFGATLGAGMQNGPHDFSSMATLLMFGDVADVNIGIRYFYNDKYGINANYQTTGSNGTPGQLVHARGGVKIPLFGDLVLEPYAGFAVGNEGSNPVSSAEAGIFLRYGKLLPRNPNTLTPYSLSPKAEDF